MKTNYEIRKDFPILNNSKFAYLDSGATSQSPKCVLDAVSNYYKKYNANPHRGTYSLSIKATNLFDEARACVQKFLNAKHFEEIIFTKNASEGINLVAYSYALNNLKKGDEIVLSIMEHHSNLVPWQMVAQKTGAKLKFMYLENFEIAKNEYKKITKNTKLVAISACSNVLGTKNDLKTIIDLAHKVKAKVLVDITQLVMHQKFDVQKLDVDFAVFSGHKIYAPQGTGVLYGKKEILESMPPFLLGGDMIEYVYEDSATFAPLPQKFEAGTQNVGGAVGLKTAIDYLENIGFKNIEKIENELVTYALKKLRSLKFLEVYAPQKNNGNVISFNIIGVHAHDVATFLDKENVFVRAGNHCAQPLLRYLKLSSTLRASLNFYNTKEEIDRLCDALTKTAKIFKKI